MSEKKIAVLVIISLKGGGAEQSVLTLGKGFHERGYDTHIVTFKPRVEYELLPELHYHLFNMKRFKWLPKSIRYRIMSIFLDRFILQKIGKPSIVLSNLELPDQVLCNSRLDNVATIIRNNLAIKHDISLDNPDKKSSAYRWINHTYSQKPCVCLSKGLEIDLKKLLEQPPTMTTINNPFDHVRIRHNANAPLPDSLSEEVRAIVESGNFLIHLGSFKPQKAHDTLLNAYAASSQKLPLLLLGKGHLINNMQQLSRDLGISENVYFLGFHKNPYPFVKRASALVLSSVYEGFVRVIPEALVLATPVISTDCPYGPSEVLPPKNLSPVGDVATLTTQMNACMENPQAFLVPFDERLLPQNIAEQYEDFFAMLETAL